MSNIQLVNIYNTSGQPEYNKLFSEKPYCLFFLRQIGLQEIKDNDHYLLTQQEGKCGAPQIKDILKAMFQMQQSENLTSSEVLSIEWHYEFPELLNMTEDTVSYIASRSWMKSVSAGIFLHKSRNQHRMQICQMKEDFDPEQVNLEDYTPKN